MSAAAAAAKTSQALVGERVAGREAALALSLVVAGGLVEGAALGTAQAVGLGRWLPALRRSRWRLVTVAVAGLGWAAASAPAVLSTGDGDARHPWLLVVAGAAGLGVLMGAALGAAQAPLLRGHVRHPWRWVAANALAWPATMTVIFIGAGTPAADWPVAGVVGLGAATGLAAGALLGLVSGWYLPSLAGPPAYDRAVLGVLGSPAHRLLDRALVALRIRGAVTGRELELPVMYAADQDDTAGLVVLPGRPDTKRWWRNLREPSRVQVLLHGTWRPAVAVVLRPGDPGYAAAQAGYRQRWRRVRLAGTEPLVHVEVGPAEDRRPATEVITKR